MNGPPLEELAQRVIRLALEGSATDAECTAVEGDEFSVNVRMGEVENLKEAGSRGVGLRVLIGARTGSAYTSDLSAEGLQRVVRSAVELASITTEDPQAGLPEPGELGSAGGDLQLYSGDVAALAPEDRISMARDAESAALGFDPRIVNSEGAAFEAHTGLRVFANSRGFLGSYRGSRCSLSVIPVARDGESMERDFWYTASRRAAALEPPAEVGRIAAQRALRRLNPRKITTRKAPVVFEAQAARSLLGHLFEAVSGDSVYRQASFLAGRLGQKIASEKLTVVDDGTLPGLFGSAPFDAEGTPTRRTAVVENGVLLHYLLNVYTGRKLGRATTGNASRGLTGNAHVGHHNLFAEPGATPAAQIIGRLRAGLLVTELIGFGFNAVTGDYSRGAVGLWIENGEIAYPVSEITIAGNLRTMLENIEAVGDDLEFRGPIACPTLLIGEMTLGGTA